MPPCQGLCAKAYAPMAVSQTGEKHGWKKNRSPSSTMSSSKWRNASTRSGSSLA